MKYFINQDKFINEMFDDPFIMQKYKSATTDNIDFENAIKELTAIVNSKVPAKIPNIKKDILKVIEPNNKKNAKADLVFVTLSNLLLKGFKNIFYAEDEKQEFPNDYSGVLTIYSTNEVTFKDLNNNLSKKGLDIKTVFPNFDISKDEPQFIESKVEPQLHINSSELNLNFYIKFSINLIKSKIREDLYILDFNVEAKDKTQDIDLSNYLDFSYKTKYDKYINPVIDAIFSHIATQLNTIRIDSKKDFPLIGDNNTMVKSITKIRNLISNFSKSLSKYKLDVFF